jgi:hypothetical protein
MVATVDFRFARQNEAAGAADAAAWVMSAVLILGSDKLWVTSFDDAFDVSLAPETCREFPLLQS